MPIKWERVLVLRGSSYFVCIPPEIVKTLQWLVGDPLEIWMDEGLQAAIVKKKESKEVHRIEPYKGAVREYFITKEEVRK